MITVIRTRSAQSFLVALHAEKGRLIGPSGELRVAKNETTDKIVFTAVNSITHVEMMLTLPLDDDGKKVSTKLLQDLQDMDLVVLHETHLSLVLSGAPARCRWDVA